MSRMIKSLLALVLLAFYSTGVFGQNPDIEILKKLNRGFLDAAVNRDIDGTCFLPSEKMTIEESLLAHTLYAATSVHEEHIKGSITVGKLADIALLNQNLFQIDPKHIKDT